MPPEPTNAAKRRSTRREADDFKFDGGHAREIESKRSRGEIRYVVRASHIPLGLITSIFRSAVQSAEGSRLSTFAILLQMNRKPYVFDLKDATRRSLVLHVRYVQRIGTSTA